MRTSGTTNELWMTAMPLGVVVLFAMAAAGGPHALFRSMERALRVALEWAV